MMPYSLNCIYCQRPLVHPKIGRKRKTCSHACRQSAWRSGLDKRCGVMHVTRDDLETKAREYMLKTYGPVPHRFDEQARDIWYAGYGMLVDFIGDLNNASAEGAGVSK